VRCVSHVCHTKLTCMRRSDDDESDDDESEDDSDSEDHGTESNSSQRCCACVNVCVCGCVLLCCVVY
jgi:hypothetical protein